jgi:hypothetical protein
MQIGKELEAMMKSAEALKGAASDLKESSKQMTEQNSMFGETTGELKGFAKNWGNTLKSALGPFGKVGHALGKDMKKFFTKDDKSGAAAKEAANETRRTAVKQQTMMGAIAANTKRTADGIKGVLKGLKDRAVDLGLKGLGLTVALIAAPVIMIVSFFKQLSLELAFLKKLAGTRLGRLFQPVKSFISLMGRIGKLIANVVPGGARAGRGITRIFQTIGRGAKTIMGFIRTIGSSIRGLITPVIRMARTSTSFMKGFAPIARFASKMGTILGKLFLPITIIMTVFDFVTGFMEGYKEDGIIGGIREGVAKVFGNLIGWPLNMLKSGVAWILEKFGFTELSTKLGEMDFKQIVMDLVRMPFNALKAIIKWVKLLFTDPAAAMAKLWTGMSNLFQIAKDAMSAIWTWITDKLSFASAGIAGAWTTVSAKVKEIWDKVVEWFTGLWSWASAGISGTWTGLVGFIKEKFDGVITFLKDLFTWPKTPLGFATKLIDIILFPYNLLINFLADIFGWGDDDEGKMPFSLGTFIIEKILAVVTWVKEKFAFVAGAVVEGWTGLKTFIADAALAVKDWIVGKFTFVAGAVIAGWTGLKEFIAEKALAIKDWIVGKFTFLTGAVIAGWTGLGTFIADAALAVKDWIVGKFTFGKDALIAGWTGLSTFIADAALAVKDWIVGKFTFGAGAVIAGWDGLLSLVTTAVNGIKDFFWKGDGTGLLEFELPDLSLNLPTLDELLGMLPEWMTSPIQWLKSKIPFFGSKKEPETAPPADPDAEKAGRYDMAKTFHDMIGNMSWGVGTLFKKFFDVEDMLGVMKLVGFRAGGYLKANQLAMVGEEGPELFMTGTGGTVIPNHALGPVESGGQQPIIVNNTTAAPVTTNTNTAVKVASAIGISDPFTNVAVAY